MQNMYLPDHQGFIRWHDLGGDAPILVWLPGIGFPAIESFEATLAYPAIAGSRSILIDPMGAGSSDPVPGLSIVSHADTVAGGLDGLGLSRCTIVGYSMGGAIAAELAVRRPDLVERLVFAEGNLLSGGGPGSRYMAEESEDAFRTERLPGILKDLRAGAVAGDPVDAFIHAQWSRIDPGVLQGMARALVELRADLAGDVFALAIDRYYVYGAKSLEEPGGPSAKNLPEPQMLEAAGITLRVLETTGHDLMLSDPSGFAGIIANILAP